VPKKLKAYSAVAVGALACVPTASAAIHYSGIKNLTLDARTTPVNVDINSDGVTDFVFTATRSAPSLFFRKYGLSINTNTSGSIGGISWINESRNANPMNLTASYVIGPNLANPPLYWNNGLYGTLAFYQFSRGYSYRSKYSKYWTTQTSTDGNFTGRDGYIGVRFRTAGCTAPNFLYGWIQFSAQSNASQGTIIDWAYEDSCNTPILAGETARSLAQPVSVPTLNQWGLLVLVGLLAGGGAFVLRRREAEE